MLLNALNSAVSGLEINKRRLQQSAHNLANVSTPAYVPARIEQGDIATGGVRQIGSTYLLSGGLQITDRSLDLAINGGGFFVLNDPDYGQVYTRAGNFSVNQEGTLTDHAGRSVTPAINIPANTSQLNIDSQGVWQSFDNKGNLLNQTQMQTASFANTGGLLSLGGNNFVPTSASGPAILNPPGTAGHGDIISGVLQASGTDLAREMVEQLVTQHSFEANIKTIQTVDQMLGSILNIKA
ncbi:MAG: flagellar hook-basal body complex protein [Desulfarculales bacterium]|jgi:flagellar basal body rod protein FlgG|nr:flagellar hook-basal body complex protein [Desulfarculales bacterium]